MSGVSKRLRRLLYDPDYRVHSRAIKFLSEIKSARVLAILGAAAVDHPDEFARKRVAAALGNMGRPAVRTLIRALEKCPVDTRSEVVRALVKTRSHLAFRPIAKVMADKTWGYRWGCPIALTRLGDRRAVPLFIEGLKEPEDNFRYGAVAGLKAMGDASAIKPLKKLLATESHPSIRRTARNALRAARFRALHKRIRRYRFLPHFVRRPLLNRLARKAHQYSSKYM